MKVIEQNANNPDIVFFIDPPYTASGKKAGARLYTYSEIDHEQLFSLAGTVAGDFIMTYDDSEGVKILADRSGFEYERVAMKNTHHTEMMELIISRNLDWLRK